MYFDQSGKNGLMKGEPVTSNGALVKYLEYTCGRLWNE
jgi:hypothetical protein